MSRALVCFLFLFLASDGMLHAQSNVVWAEPEKVAQVQRGEVSVAYVVWWGFDAKDSTRFLQAALHSGAKRVIVSCQPAPWITCPLKLASNQEVLFEAGTELVAKRGAFRGRTDALLCIAGQTNCLLRGLGPGVRLRMWRDDYAKAPYARAEWRHGISILSAKNVTIENVSVSETGGDGVYIGVCARGMPCRNVVLRDVVCARNWRQGVSVISCDGLLMERCTMKETKGTPPEAGIDFEPNHAHDVLANCVLRDCLTENNAGKGFMFMICQLGAKSRPVGFRLENCRSIGDDNGLAYQLGSNDYDVSYDDGSLEVLNCRFEKSRHAAIVVTRKAYTSGKAVFRDCIIREACTEKPKASDVSVTVFGHGAYPADVIAFERVSVLQPVARNWIQYPTCARYRGCPTVLSGSVRVESPSGLETVTMDEAWRKAVFPYDTVRKPLARKGFDPTAVHVVDPSPGAWLELSKIRSRFDVSYVFYADCARMVRIRGVLTGIHSDKLGKRITYSLTTFDGKTQLAGGDLMGGPEWILDRSVPAAGFYRLKVRTWSSAFRLKRADVPVAIDVSAGLANFVAMAGSLYYYVPCGEPSDVFVTGEPYEYVSAQILDASGQSLWSEMNFCNGAWAQFAASPCAGVREIRILAPQGRRVFEDFSVGVYGVKGLLFLSPDRYWY